VRAADEPPDNVRGGAAIVGHDAGRVSSAGPALTAPLPARWIRRSWSTSTRSDRRAPDAGRPRWGGVCRPDGCRYCVCARSPLPAGAGAQHQSDLRCSFGPHPMGRDGGAAGALRHGGTRKSSR
jgi:hypothetical protein